MFILVSIQCTNVTDKTDWRTHDGICRDVHSVVRKNYRSKCLQLYDEIILNLIGVMLF